MPSTSTSELPAARDSVPQVTLCAVDCEVAGDVELVSRTARNVAFGPNHEIAEMVNRWVGDQGPIAGRCPCNDAFRIVGIEDALVVHVAIDDADARSTQAARPSLVKSPVKLPPE